MTEVPEAQRKKLITLLAQVLRAVHAALLQSLKTKREARERRSLTPIEWFNMLSNEPAYVWIRELTTLLSDVDALLDNRSEISENDFATVRNAVEALFGAQALDSKSEFKDRYFDSLAADPELVLPNATLSRVLHSWPVTPAKGDLAAVRRDWHIGERRLAHLQATGPKKQDTNQGTKSESEG